jgi:hypothetical protein
MRWTLKLQRRDIQLDILVGSQVGTIVNIGISLADNAKWTTSLHVQLGTWEVKSHLAWSVSRSLPSFDLAMFRSGISSPF